MIEVNPILEDNSAEEGAQARRSVTFKQLTVKVADGLLSQDDSHVALWLADDSCPATSLDVRFLQEDVATYSDGVDNYSLWITASFHSLLFHLLKELINVLCSFLVHAH